MKDDEVIQSRFRIDNANVQISYGSEIQNPDESEAERKNNLLMELVVAPAS